MKVVIACPSLGRADAVLTASYVTGLKVYVSPEEYDDYVDGPTPMDAEIVRCDEGIQGNLCRVRNFMIERELVEGDADILVIVDDDLRQLVKWVNNERVKIPSEDVPAFIETYSALADEWGAKFWGLNVNSDKQVYREFTPFSTVKYIGGPFQAILRGNVCRYDESLPLKEDYDFTLQNLNRYRVALRVNFAYYLCQQASNVGGCATYRSMDAEREQYERLVKKWGPEIVRRDRNARNHMTTKKKSHYDDFNPVIHVPIRGV